MDTNKTRVNPYILAGVSPASHRTPVVRERRAYPRHLVDAEANIVFVKGGLSLRGNILNLSLIGCRIRCDERFPVGIYTRVETEFHIGGMPFRLAGVIQAIHSPRDVGIRFLDVSPRKRDQIQQLICEVEEMRPAPSTVSDGAAGAQS